MARSTRSCMPVRCRSGTVSRSPSLRLREPSVAGAALAERGHSHIVRGDRGLARAGAGGLPGQTEYSGGYSFRFVPPPVAARPPVTAAFPAGCTLLRAICANFSVRFGIVRRGPDVCHARDPNELLEVFGDELRPIVGDDPGPQRLFAFEPTRPRISDIIVLNQPHDTDRTGGAWPS